MLTIRYKLNPNYFILLTWYHRNKSLTTKLIPFFFLFIYFVSSQSPTIAPNLSIKCSICQLLNDPSP